MKILHIAAHLGGGVGKAHAAISAVMPDSLDRTYVLLEPPRDNRYVDEIAKAGAEVVIAPKIDALLQMLAEADIVQFEFWNHPRLYALLARPDLPPLRSIFWCHISGLFVPKIAPDLIATADRFVFTSPCSLGIPGMDEGKPRLTVIGSGFGFEAPPSSGPKTRIIYLGTVDFIKLHPDFFTMIDAVARPDFVVEVIGGFDPQGAVASAHAAMRKPHRVQLLGHRPDPQSVLSNCAIFLYPLQPEHYGTAENALIEAMSLGAAPLVLNNPAECAIVEDGQTGRVAASIPEMGRILRQMIDDPEMTAKLGAAAASHIAATRTAQISAAAFSELYMGLAQQPKSSPCYATAIGTTPRDWFLSTQGASGASASALGHAAESKGSLAHFLAAFPDDPGLLGLAG